MPQDELKKLIEELEALERRFQATPMLGVRLPPKDQGKYQQLLLDAVSIIKSEFGPYNDHFSGKLAGQTMSGSGIGPSLPDLHSACAVLQAVINQLNRIRNRPPVVAGATSGRQPYVAASRISELRAAPTTHWDTRRLVRMLEELNTAHAHEMYLTTGMLVRAITDHVPPVFGKSGFAEVAANHSAGAADGRSWKGAMNTLKDSMKHIADGILHQQIRQKEVLPTEPGVDFRAPLDLLLAEVVRVLR